jgi:hypothetical protein
MVQVELNNVYINIGANDGSKKFIFVLFHTAYTPTH